ncbi:tyrosine-type recombinase/integrase [Chryseobacterium sp. SL1]|uniref:tyrosine-type recombinase/integrase n=1 Tax=Chryseobacterium sp. SL1 TaxID=2995159 RepID=UPI002273AAE8|nr:tyrosine-type recombinase/integrase [Chryseobacterium sp. SL1]MCY1662639.1 tyrosine-type recombinase/integrase [Chryseobacterium sp. SL1]
MCRLGYECYIPVSPKCSFQRAVSTVFTHEQILDIFGEVDHIISKTRCPKNMLMPVPALIRTLYSTGIRIGEALSIKNKDVDFERKAIVINDTKNNKQRLAPINESLEKVLKQYISYRDRIPIHDINHPESCLFVSTLGKPCSHTSIYKYFIHILQVCGIHGGYGNNSATLHSIRHTSAVHALIKMTKAGKDLYCSLPLLSVFMGHKSIIGTEYYIRLTQEMYPEVLKLDMEVTDRIFAYINQKLQQNYENGDN